MTRLWPSDGLRELLGDDPLARAAMGCLAGAPQVVARHSARMAALALALAERDGLDVDRSGVVCACAFHDLGLTTAGPGWFAGRSALLLGDFLDGQGVPAARAAPLQQAIREHLRPLPHGRSRPLEVRLVQRVAWLDALGVGDAGARRLRDALRAEDGDPRVDVPLLAALTAGCLRDLTPRRPGAAAL